MTASVPPAAGRAQPGSRLLCTSSTLAVNAPYAPGGYRRPFGNGT